MEKTVSPEKGEEFYHSCENGKWDNIYAVKSLLDRRQHDFIEYGMNRLVIGGALYGDHKKKGMHDPYI